MANEGKQIGDLELGEITSDDDVFIMDTYEGITVKIPYSILRNAVANAITPSIDSTSKHWYVGSVDTGVVAEGQDGATGATGASISATEIPITNGHRVTISSTDPNVSDVVFDLTNGANGTNGTDGDDGASISVTTTTITGGHSVTFHSTDPNVNDQTFDVMDGTEIIQTSSDDRLVTLTVAGWQGVSVPYTQSVTVLGMTSNIVPIIAPSFSDTVATGLKQQTEWAKITKAVSDTNSITFKCYKDKPTVELTALVKVV